ncbi:hypothetical protein [Janthinobacterium sp. RB2R34]|uniref:hypothetical protein n=1 Tax=Janthinobacterium sp. RB2R34 TaxID=3424193 RepID=UPI003F26FD13
MKKLLLLICLPLLLAACGAFSGALSDADVARYIKAYDNFAAAAPELNKLKSEDQAMSLLTCGPCLVRLEKAVQDAGYKDMKTFIAFDIRMHVTLRAWAYVAITKLAGESGQAVAAEDFCKIKENIARSKDAAEMKVHCTRLKSYTSFLDKAGAFAVKLAEKLLKDGDIDVVARHIDAISAALSNEKLPADLRHSGGGFDD